MCAKKFFWAVAALMLIITTAVPVSCTKDYGPDPVTDDKPFPFESEIDNSVSPGDNFYRYAIGQWLDNPDRTPSMMKQIEEQLQQVQDNALATSQNPLLVKLRSQVDATLADDNRNVTILKERLQMLEQVKTADQLHDAFGTLYSLGYSTLFRLLPSVSEGKKISLTFSTGGMPEEMIKVFRYSRTTQIDSLVHAYCKPLAGLGYSKERIDEIINNAIAVETMASQAYMVGFEMIQQRFYTHPLLTKAENASQKVGVICEKMGLSPDDIISGRVFHSSNGVVNMLTHFACVGDVQAEIDAYRDYMIYNVVAQDAPFVPSACTQTDQNVMLQRALQYNRYFKYRLLVEYYGKENIYKQECEDILERMRKIFIQRIDNLDWMGEATKAEARKKAEAMKFYIGYPEQWDDAMTPAADGDCLLETVTRLRQDAIQKNFSMAGKSLDSIPWSIWTAIAQFTTDNAFYQPAANSLVILPAWITRPRIDNSLSEAATYATAITFAHEFCHGFDSTGSMFDADGMLRDWWEPVDKEAFQLKQKAMIELFNQLEDYPGQNANGEKTLRENMADYGGVELTLACYKQRLAELGFTGEQFDAQIRKFFLSYAVFWKMERELSLDELKHYHEIDVHALPHVRINGQMRLQDDWYRLYDVKPTDKLYLAPEKRVKIW